MPNPKLLQYILASHTTLLSNQTQQALPNVTDLIIVV